MLWKAVLSENLKGTHCSEPVKFRLPCIGFLWKKLRFLSFPRAKVRHQGSLGVARVQCTSLYEQWVSLTLRCFETVFQRPYQYFSISFNVILPLSDRYKISPLTDFHHWRRYNIHCFGVMLIFPNYHTYILPWLVHFSVNIVNVTFKRCNKICTEMY